MGKPLKCGPIGSKVVEMPIGASEVFKDLSGHFVKPDASGRMEIAGATDVNIVGWMLQGERTASATEGADKGDVMVDLEEVYLIPAYKHDGTAPTEANLIATIGETCDIVMISTSYQCADINTSAVDILQIVGYEYHGSAVGQQFVKVKVNIEKIVNTGVA